MAKVQTTQNPSDDVIDNDNDPKTDPATQTDLSPTAETITKDSFVGKFCIKFGYLYLVLLNIGVYFYDNVPISLQLLSTSLGCIIVGSFNSLRHPESAEAKDVEKLKPKDAYMFPIFGSIALLTFYVMIKYLPPYVIDVFVQLFFVFMSAFAAQSLFDELCEQFLPAPIFNLFNIKLFTLNIKWNVAIKLPIGDKTYHYPTFSFNPPASTQKDDNVDSIDMTCLNIITLIIGSVVAYFWYIWDQWWLFNNLIGISLSIQAISFLNPGSYYTASVLLSLLFFYDIFWVFGNDVMVTVAKNLKAPIKLIFPRPAVLEKPNMLGLGDIVLPGIYVALLLRYDIKQNYKNINFKNLKNITLPSLNINTFYICLFCYFLSLTTCVIIMWYFEAAQPALLYIVPGIIIPIILFTFIRGDFNELWSYDEESKDDKKKD